MATQRKETGTTVDFTQGRPLPITYYAFRDDVVGILATQKVPVTIDAATRDAFLNGNLTDVVNQTWSQGMQTEYAVFSWNETAQNGNYVITDCRIGIVAKITRDYNAGSAYLIDCLKAVPWTNSMLSKLSMFTHDVWQAWLLIPPPAYSGTKFFSSTWDSTSGAWYKGAPIGSEVVDPTNVELFNYFLTHGNLDVAIGAFVRKFLDMGYNCTVLGYKAVVCLEEKGPIPVPGQPYYVQKLYHTHTRLTIDYTTDAPEPTVGDAKALFPVIIAQAIVALIIIVAIGLASGVEQWFNNMSKEETTDEEFGWVQNPGTGEWEWVVVSRKKTTAPPDWWGYVIPIVALMGIGAGVYLIVPYLRKGEGRRK